MKKSTFCIFLLIILGLVEDVSVEESKVKSSSIELAEKQNLAAVVDNIDDGFTELTEKIERLEQKVSEMANSLSGLVNRVETLETEAKELNNRQEKGRNETLSLKSNFTLEWEGQITGLKSEQKNETYLNPELNATESTAQSNCSTRKAPVDCKSLMNNGCFRNGVYTIRLNASENTTLEAFCDLEDDDGGWTVIQRRGVRDIPKAQREDFNRSWTEYERGFGSVDDDHWLGLQQMHTLTRDCENELKVTLTAWNGTQFYAKYSNFQISGVEDDYRLTIGNFTAGTLSHSLYRHMDWNNGIKFSTFDKDNDKWSGRNCAVSYGGAWWHRYLCSWVSLNGEYAEDGTNGRVNSNNGIYWFPDYWQYNSFKKTEMKIRSKC